MCDTKSITNGRHRGIMEWKISNSIANTPGVMTSFTSVILKEYVTDHITQQKRFQPAADIEKSKLFRELNQFLLSERIQKPVDSVCLTYGVNVYLPETATVRFDTIFSFTYNPNTIAASKK